MSTILIDLTPLDTPSRRRGPGRYLREMARGLASLSPAELRGLKLVGLTHLGLDGSFRTTEDIAGFEGSPKIPSPGPRDHYHWAYARRFGMWRALRAIEPDAFHLGDPNATPLLTQLTPARRVVTCHDAIPLRWPERYFGVHDGGPRIGAFIEQRRYRTADLVVAISDATARDAVKLLLVRPHKLVRVHNGIGIQEWAREPTASAPKVLEKHGLAGAKFVLYVGGSDWHKNVEGMLGGIAHARAQGLPIILAWAASLTDAKRASVRDMAVAAGVGDAVRMLGYVPDHDLAVLYRHALAHLLVSHCEGFGLTIVEAMASGCAVVTTDRGSLAEVAGNAALEVDPNDHTAIGNAIVRLWSTPTLRADLVRRGRARAPLFSRDIQAKAMVDAYLRAVSV